MSTSPPRRKGSVQVSDPRPGSGQLPSVVDPAASDLASGPFAEPAETDFFVCDIFDALPKDDMATMEHPVFSLSTRPDLRILRYMHNDVAIEVTPSVKGLATIHDKDILIYCVSQLMAASNAGRPISRTLTLRAHDLLLATGRETSGDAYRRLTAAFQRLSGTRITTNLADRRDGNTYEVTTGFGLIDSWRVVRRAGGSGSPPQGRAGRMVSVSVVLSDWLYHAVRSKSVLTIDRGYFRLRKPLERRIYELARKHCGRQEGWRISLDILHLKSGSASPRRVFRRMVRDMIAADILPDYVLWEEAGDIIRVAPRPGLLERTRSRESALGTALAPLTTETLAAARALAPGQDVHALEARWRAYWAASGRPILRSPGAAFLGYVRATRAGQAK